MGICVLTFLCRWYIIRVTFERINPIANKLKKALVERLSKTYSAEVVRKGVARGERWIAAAYGKANQAGWNSRFDEDGGNLDDLAGFFCSYCEEVKRGENNHSFNRDAFGCHRTR